MATSRLKKIRRTLGGETTLEGAIDAMGKEREEQVLELLSEFMNRVVVMVSKLQDVVQRFVDDRYEELEESAKELDVWRARPTTSRSTSSTGSPWAGSSRCTVPTSPGW